MKKILFILTTFIFILSLSGCELLTGIPSEKKIVSIEIDSSSIEEEVDINEFTIDSIRIICIYDDESIEYVQLTESMISTIDLAKLQESGIHEIQVNYLDYCTTFSITITDLMNAGYLVQFVDYDGTILKEENVEEHSEATAPLDPTREGYTFIGWDKAFADITQEEIITAQYQIITYTVKFIDYDGTILLEETVNYNEMATPPTAPSREGYAFINWDESYTSVNQNLEINAVYRSNENFELDGYTIKIAVSASELAKVDPFLPTYRYFDKPAKQYAWKWVEDTYNCNIEVVAYPSNAEWGTPRWNYILNQAAAGIADYDFYTVPDAKIGTFVDNQAIIDVKEWYTQYGEDLMHDIYIQSGSYLDGLYSITDEEPSINNVMYYNIRLLSRLGLEKTPAQIFNEGNWTYTAFKEYCIAAQNALDNLHEASTTNKFYAVSGCSTYYWVGMTSAGGEKIADASNAVFQPLTETALSAASTLKAIREAGAMDPIKQVDAGVLSWNNGRALFSSGFLWFVNTNTRWREDLWTPGNSDLTQYGYVPFPRPDQTTKEEQKLGVGGINTWVMPIGRDYSAYGPQCTPENIYRVMVKAFQLTKEYCVTSPGYDYDQGLEAYAQRYTESEDSVIAFMYISKRANNIGFFEPLTEPLNQVVNTGYSSFSTAVNDYIMGNYSSLLVALDSLQYSLADAIRKAFPQKQ